MFKLYLDPGHGGSDSGAVGNGLEEKDLTLDIALRTRKILVNEYKDVEVRMSRTTDVFRSLNERTDEANTYGADYYLSIHINAYNGLAHGYEDFVHNSLSDSSKTAQYRNIMHEEIVKVNDLYDRGKKKANFHVLRETKMASLLTENGFIDNANDAKKLKSSNWCQKVAQGHVNGLVRAFNLKRKDDIHVHRVIVDGIQVGAYQDDQNVLDAVKHHLKTANRIVVEKV
ncbi:N-acetylmuramoyl-L-alanine amidase [Bacillus idriensis]|uniref:N-acetylmuramoyl-L-alanine amidase n=1 Tax=Metabacillus idriensis TaxID=324768 RepID=A0A6I2MFD8_9BACI|nr:N-acetylmuramoyl-L-alanine amidase [Metabacillus idriensis]MRX57070.1 N-acetylmuramoyl-L-alanine amidase [Metabacillus idriensis]